MCLALEAEIRAQPLARWSGTPVEQMSTDVEVVEAEFLGREVCNSVQEEVAQQAEPVEKEVQWVHQSCRR